MTGFLLPPLAHSLRLAYIEARLSWAYLRHRSFLLLITGRVVAKIWTNAALNVCQDRARYLANLFPRSLHRAGSIAREANQCRKDMASEIIAGAGGRKL